MRKGAGVLWRTGVVVVTVVTILCAIVCDDPPSGPGIVIDKPVVEPVPSHQAIEVSNRPVMIWPSANTFDQTARYELYLDTINPPTLLADNLTDTVFEPDFLEPGQTYYWQVVSKGVRRGFPVSPLWSFTTRSVVYPISVDNWWNYEIKYWYENIQPASLRRRYGDTIRVHVRVEIDDYQGGVEGPGRYRFHSAATGGPGRPTGGYSYYEMRQDGLYLVAVEGAAYAAVLPKLGHGGSSELNECTFDVTNGVLAVLGQSMIGLHSAGSNDLFPQKCFEYPLRVGNQWAYLEQEPGFLRIDRRVVDRQNIRIGLGDFDCFVIHHFYDLAGDGAWDENIEEIDYIANEGLIRNTSRVLGLRIADWSQMGTADFFSEAILTDFRLVRP